MGLLAWSSHGVVTPITGPVTQQVNVTGALDVTLESQTSLDALLQARSELDALVPAIACTTPVALAITSFALDNPADVEIGTQVVNPSFTAAYSASPTSVTLTNDANAESKDVSATPNAFASDQTYQQTTPNAQVAWTLTASDGSGSDTAQETKTWRARLFVGWTTNPGPYTEADILALNELTNGLDPDALFDLTLSPTNGGAGAYLVAAYHDAFNGAVPTDFEIGTFGNGDVTEIQTGVVMTVPGGSAPYSVARSDFAVEAPSGIRFARET